MSHILDLGMLEGFESSNVIASSSGIGLMSKKLESITTLDVVSGLAEAKFKVLVDGVVKYEGKSLANAIGFYNKF